MPRYWFDLRDDIDVIDQEGQEFPDLATAVAEAIQDARGLMAASIGNQGEIDLSHYINVRGEDHRVLATVPFSEAVTVRRGHEVVSGPDA